jgi:hypothetical protein
VLFLFEVTVSPSTLQFIDGRTVQIKAVIAVYVFPLVLPIIVIVWCLLLVAVTLFICVCFGYVCVCVIIIPGPKISRRRLFPSPSLPPKLIS